MTSDTILDERYRLRDSIGKGGQARTYRAEVLETGREVAIKMLDLEAIDDWKEEELFEREAEALHSIDHPRVPDYIDGFQTRTEDGGIRCCLVQEYVEGQSLKELLEGGTQFDELEAIRLARELLEILEYLHDLDPPVIHRDLKPSNILRRPDGSYVLVDFGGVRVAIPDDKGGSTIIGSHGHMPHEQLMGRAEPASDLYGLGATLVHVLSRKHPSELTTGVELEFRDHVRVSEGFARFLEDLLEPTLEDRIGSAGEAHTRLEEHGSWGEPSPPSADESHSRSSDEETSSSRPRSGMEWVWASIVGLGGLLLVVAGIVWLLAPGLFTS